MPGIGVEELGENWSLSKHEPRPISSYLFLVDYRLYTYTTESFPCVRDIRSRLYEPEECVIDLTEPSDADERAACPYFKFNADGFHTSFQTEVVVYAIDKSTGTQAKLFRGKRSGHIGGENGILHRFLGDFADFPNFFVQSFFEGKRGTYGAPPNTSGSLLGYEDDDTPLEVSIRLAWKNTEKYSTTYTYFGGMEFLTILEKGLSWGERTACKTYRGYQ